MNITKEIKELVRNFSDDYVLTASDFDFGPQSKAAVVKALNRMADSGELMKLSKGKFYKPRKTQFGTLKPSVYQIAKYRRAVKREKYTISFILQPNPITRKNIEVLRILDAIRFIREIPGTSPDEACLRLKEIIKELDDEQKKILVKCTLQYTSYVRALCGAILENTGCDKELLGIIRKSLNGITEYKLPLSASVLPTKQNWKIYEPTRK